MARFRVCCVLYVCLIYGISLTVVSVEAFRSTPGVTIRERCEHFV